MMQIEMNCPGCGRKLRVDSDHAGKPARCPVCSTIYTVPSSSTAEPVSDSDRWHMKTPDGQAYGPVSRHVLDKWVTEGRVSDDCLLMLETEGIWKDASTIYPVLKPVPKGIVAPTYAQPFPDAPVPPNIAQQSGRILNPHRGSLVLILGVLSWAIGCPILGVMAWAMGSNDLRDMRRGIMDARGMGLTQAGLYIGMIHAIICLIGIFISIFVAIVMSLFA